MRVWQMLLIGVSFMFIGLLFVSLSPSEIRIAPMVVGPEVLILEDYESCGLPHDSTGYRGWPTAVLGSLDDQSCSGASAMIYERLYPVGLLINLSIGVVIGYVGYVMYKVYLKEEDKK